MIIENSQVANVDLHISLFEAFKKDGYSYFPQFFCKNL